MADLLLHLATLKLPHLPLNLHSPFAGTLETHSGTSHSPPHSVSSTIMDTKLCPRSLLCPMNSKRIVTLDCLGFIIRTWLLYTADVSMQRSRVHFRTPKPKLTATQLASLLAFTGCLSMEMRWPIKLSVGRGQFYRCQATHCW